MNHDESASQHGSLSAEQLRLALDACRPGSRDLQSPELSAVAQKLKTDRAARETYHRLQQFDAHVTAAFQDVEVPADLGQRILARLQTSATSEPTEQTSPQVELVRLPVDVTSRRRWISSAVAVAASLLVVGALSGYLPLGGAPSGSEPAAIADAWYSGLGEKWQPAATAPRGFVVPASVAATARGCQLIQRGVWAFNLTAPGSRKATLFVAKMPLPGLPSVPPVKPQSSTGGRNVGVWQSGGLVYFLVVEGDDHRYRTFINSSSSPLA